MNFFSGWIFLFFTYLFKKSIQLWKLQKQGHFKSLLVSASLFFLIEYSLLASTPQQKEEELNYLSLPEQFNLSGSKNVSTEKNKIPKDKTNDNKSPPGFSESLDNSSSPSLLILAQAYEQKGDYKNQIRILRIVSNRETDNGDHWLTLAKSLRYAYFQTHQTKYKEEFVDITNKILTMKKKYRESAYLEKIQFVSNENTDDQENKYTILKLLQKLIRDFGAKEPYVKQLCKYLHLNQFFLQSLDICKKAIKRYPDEPSNHVYYALSLKEPKNKEKGLKEAVKKFPDSTLARLELGKFFLDQKEYNSAIPYLKESVTKEPKSSEAQLSLAQALFHSGQEKISYQHFLQACMLNKSKMLWAFKQAKSILNQKNNLEMAQSFENGITQCFHKASL